MEVAVAGKVSPLTPSPANTDGLKTSTPQPSIFTSSRYRPIRIMLCLDVFVTAALLARPVGLSELERTIFSVFYNLPEALAPFFLAVTQLGGVGMILAVALVYLWRQHYHTLARILLSGSLAYILAGLAKQLVGRPRPRELLTEIVYREDVVSGLGFPSGHTALIAAIGLVAIHRFKRSQRWLVGVVIMLVAVSRLYLGVHAPLDIVGGLAIGWFCAEVAVAFPLAKKHSNRSVKRVDK